jgi:hypothetical protein
MTTHEKRTALRTESSNLISYLCLDEDNHEIMQGMGKTLNVSEGGILMETHVSIDPCYIVSLSIALENELMDFMGKIVHYREREDGKFESGIDFMELDEEKRGFLRQYIVIFKGQEKNNLR